MVSAAEQVAAVGKAAKARSAKQALPALSAVSHLLATKQLPQDQLSPLIASLKTLSALAQDVQLKVLQLLPLIYSCDLRILDDDLFDSLSIPVGLLDANGIVGSIASASLQQLISLIFERSLPECLVILQELCRIAEAGEVKIARLKGIQPLLSLELIESVTEGQDTALISKVVVPFLHEFLKSPSNSFPVCVRVARITRRLIPELFEDILEALRKPTKLQTLLFEVISQASAGLLDEQHLTLTSTLLEFEQDLPDLGSYAQSAPATEDAEVNSEGLVFESVATSEGLGEWLVPERKLLTSGSSELPSLPSYNLMLLFQIITRLSRRQSPAWRNLLRLNSAFMSSSISSTMEQECVENLASLSLNSTQGSEALTARNACLKRLGRLALSASTGRHMSPRSYHCLEAFLRTSKTLWDKFDEASWNMVLGILRSAEPLLDARRASVPDEQGKAGDIQLSSKLLQQIRDFFVTISGTPDSSFVAMLQALLMIGEVDTTTPLASPTFLRQRLLSVASITSSVSTPGPPSDVTAFNLNKLALICKACIDRFAENTDNAKVAWDLVRTYLAAEIEQSESLAAAEILGTAIRDSVESQSDPQCCFIDAIKDLTSRSLLIKNVQLETVAHVLQYVGHNLTSWELLLNVVHRAIKSTELMPASVPSTPRTPRSFSDHFPEPHERSRASNVASLVRSAFGSLELICSDYLIGLPTEHFPELVDILLLCSTQTADINISLSSVNLLWMVADALTLPADLKHDRLWQAMISALIQVAHHDQREVRNSALYIIFRILDGKLLKLGDETWSVGVQLLLEPVTGIRDSETLNLIVSSATRMYMNALAIWADSKLLHERWHEHVNLLGNAAICEGSSAVAIHNFTLLHNCVEEANISQDTRQSVAAIEIPTWLQVGDTLTSASGHTQEVLTKYIDSLRSLVVRLDDEEMLSRTAAILRAALAYQGSPSYLLDIDHVTALQKSILATWEILLERLPEKRPMLLSSMTESMGFSVMSPEARASYTLRRPSTASSWDGVPTFVAFSIQLLQLFERYYHSSQDEEWGCMIACLAQLNKYIGCRFEAASVKDAARHHIVWQNALELAFKLLEAPHTQPMTQAAWAESTTLACHLFAPSENQSEEYVLTALNRLHARLVPAIGEIGERPLQRYCNALFEGSFFEHSVDGTLVAHKDGLLREWCLLELLRMSTLGTADGTHAGLEVCGETAMAYTVQRSTGLLESLMAAFPTSGHAPIKEPDMHALTILLQHLADPEVVSQARPRVRELCRASWPGLVKCLSRCARSEAPKGLAESIEAALLQIGRECI
ncbi:hypothetical protein BCR37DRAFT_394703 [Protomyces lactucae-debilis]|uniref:Mon2/Sec7/BIG1-like dimerisation and cyclophilin-binding domain-containing protein n=1 Tax=Protomyces lactucae-debilis TaxID=2754530 RepID=A0A1Y2F2Y0_PROLT|nr:uncharacterized protein BCR37DRAFT_394703 [Protomyces lactucae-debilis]ORY78203.1 hypothetical protein BCR37DRAFT_394703 [Protomyces lactucae-debilis]